MLILRSANLDRANDIAHGFFGRNGGVSKGLFASLNCGPGSADAREHIEENRRRVADALQAGASLVTLRQVHGARTVLVDEPWSIDKAPEADAMVTARKGVALGILTADCVPVLLADAGAQVVGVAHAGWKGALAGIVESAVAAMVAAGAERRRIAAAVGPCISQENYEVGAELRDRFVSAEASNAGFFRPAARADHFLFDLESFVAASLSRAGIGDMNCLSTCTYARESDFFSFRRATHRGESDFGRQLSAILLCK